MEEKNLPKESLLQKEFKSRDVQRMRNLITKKYNDSTGTQIGYSKEEIDHIEGDEWEENGKIWTIQDGLKITISKLDEVKKTLQMPLVCPCCKNPFEKGLLDKKFYSFHKKCFDCTIEYETKLRQQGKYEEYERERLGQNIDVYTTELNQLFEEICDINEEKIVTEDGDIEQWVGGTINTPKLREEFKKYIETVQKTREQLK